MLPSPSLSLTETQKSHPRKPPNAPHRRSPQNQNPRRKHTKTQVRIRPSPPPLLSLTPRTVVDSIPPRKRTTGKRARRQPAPERDSDEEPIVPAKRAKTAPAKKRALETIPEESESEEDVPLRLVVRDRARAREEEEGASQWRGCGAWGLTVCVGHAMKAKQGRSKAGDGPLTGRPTARPPESEEEDVDEDVKRPSEARAPSSKSKSAKALSKPDPTADLPTAPKPPKAKNNAAVSDDAEDVRPAAPSSRTTTEPQGRVPSTSKRKLPAPPKAFVESDLESDDEPPPQRTKAAKPVRAQTADVSRSMGREDPGGVEEEEEGASASSARTKRAEASGKHRQDGKTAVALHTEHEPEPEDHAEDPAEDEEEEDSKPKRSGKAPRKRAAKVVEDTQDEAAGASRKRGRGKQATAHPTDELDEQPQEPDEEPPAPPRKRAKRAAAAVASDMEILADVPDPGPIEGDAEEPGDTHEEPAPKPRSKPASRSKKAPASRDKTQAARCVSQSCPTVLGRSVVHAALLCAV